MIQDLIAHVLAAPQAAALGDRVRPVQRAQGEALPAAVVNTISRASDITNDGPSGYEAERVQFDVYGATFAEARAGAAAIEAALHGFRGVRGATHFLGVFLDGERTGYEAGPNDAPSDRLARITIDYMVHWRPAS